MSVMICAKCHVALIPHDNDTIVDETASFGHYKLWMADTWKCPSCKIEIVSGFGRGPIAEHYQDGIAEMLERFKNRGVRIEVWNEFKLSEEN